jgi:ATP-dependent Clp protease ATP-binding subunit ClpA
MSTEHTTVSFERFTDRLRKVMSMANQEAQRFNHEYIGTEHVLLAIVKEGTTVAANALRKLDIDLRKVRLEVEKKMTTGHDMVTMGKLPYHPYLKLALERAIAISTAVKESHIGTEHLIVAIVDDEDNNLAKQVLLALGVSKETLKEQIRVLLTNDYLLAEKVERKKIEPLTSIEKFDYILQRGYKIGLDSVVKFQGKTVPTKQYLLLKDINDIVNVIEVYSGTLDWAISEAFDSIRENDPDD